jgi:hypothetical protein
MISAAKCKNCDHQGSTVRLLTLQCLLKLEQQSKLDSQHRYYFCATPNCQVVYFSPALDKYFSKADVKIPIGIKENTTPRLVCYCFNFSIETILDEIMAKGSTTISSDIKAAIKATGCDCERKNPSGHCCLGEIAQIIKHAQSSLSSNCTVKSLPQFNCCK